MVDYYLMIPSYKREAMLLKLLQEINKQSQGLKILTAVYLDGCKYGAEPYRWVQYHRERHHGREQYYKLVQKIINEAPRAKYYIYLADDMELAHDFFKRSTLLWNNISDSEKMVLNIFKDHRKGTWGSGKPEPRIFKSYTYYLTGWFDMAFICGRRFIDVFPKLKPTNIETSSGVARQLSRYYRALGNIYQVNKTLLYHGDHQSLMNPNERIKNPIIVQDARSSK